MTAMSQACEFSLSRSIKYGPLHAYKNDAVIERFMDKYQVARDEAEDIFEEMKRMLWAMARYQNPHEGPSRLSPFTIYYQMGVLDEMWHTFILFTAEYTDFCLQYFGAYLHHAPTTAKDKQKLSLKRKTDPKGTRKFLEAGLREQCSFIGEKLGAATLEKWFKVYPQRYPQYSTRSN